MDVTILGSSSAIGMPAPLCDCDYCADITRYRPSVLVETDEATVLLDASPDVREQLAMTDAIDLDAICVTHHHFDHATGLMELYHPTGDERQYIRNRHEIPNTNSEWYGKEYSVYLSSVTSDYIEAEMGHVYQERKMDFTDVSAESAFTVGDITITPFEVAHCEGMLGFVLETDEAKFSYAPDAAYIKGETHMNADLLVIDGSALLGYEIHGDARQLQRTVDDAGSDQTVFVNVSEHLAQAPTETLEERATESGGEIQTSGTTIEL